jgi:hypothetical protein
MVIWCKGVMRRRSLRIPTKKISCETCRGRKELTLQDLPIGDHLFHIVFSLREEIENIDDSAFDQFSQLGFNILVKDTM